MSENRLKRTTASALWSAYGDVMGFPTELASDRIVQQRIGHPKISRPEPWKRQIGGRFGAMIQLPAGAYSDDTQLRLSTGRAITGQGYFDVEAFAKIELPVWQCYALGAGRGSKAAAGALCNRSSSWFGNFFPNYENGGGNGAAMRVQPHVWAAADLRNKDSYLPDVIRNAVCTHGHMRGVAGAVVHAVSLAYTLDSGKVPGPEHWLELANDIRNIPKLIALDSELSTFWLPVWEQKSERSLSAAVDEVAQEWTRSVAVAGDLLATMSQSDCAIIYTQLITLENGLSKEERGSGLKCALFANVAAFLGRLYGSQEIIETVTNLLDSDTDTIATMAGALIGAANPEARFIGTIQDQGYIVAEATRLYDVSQGKPAPTFNYPDTLYWQAPRAAIDMLSRDEKGLTLAGLGRIKPVGDVFYGLQKSNAWCWFKLEFGQSVLVRYRSNAKLNSPTLSSDSGRMDTPDLFQHEQRVSKESSPNINTRPPQPLAPSPSADNPKPLDAEIDMENHRQFVSEAVPAIDEPALVSSIDLDALTNDAIKGFDPQVIGNHLLMLAEQPNAISLSIAYTSIVIKARSARLRHKKPQQ
ncbi:ADP-ribosylglycohydrolase family protein [Pseudomonas costantinii]|uniref:ADP-ribosylglycohydrolase family protein n=1 Tax=Pseudomonas costantinii TaxID=168469 RepID=UPI0015A00855|nr:ADP-ribosylglycohydrolase family protein [Pseudomonas costantinii]NVZ22682.1 ADP-ribosylglycohydrolase family protein [Pseudomonas costantinii]